MPVSGVRERCGAVERLWRDLGAVDLGLVRTQPFTKLLGQTAGADSAVLTNCWNSSPAQGLGSTLRVRPFGLGGGIVKRARAFLTVVGIALAGLAVVAPVPASAAESLTCHG